MAAADLRARLQNIYSAAVRAFNLPLVPHIEIDARMAEGALPAITGNFRAVNFNCLNSLHKAVSLLLLINADRQRLHRILDLLALHG